VRLSKPIHFVKPEFPSKWMVYKSWSLFDIYSTWIETRSL